LADLRQAGVERVDVVAHSMGGLVTRDVLTRRAYYAGDGSGGSGARYPAVDRVIMLGTPNHGSELARLRGVAELGEYLYRALTGTGDSQPVIGDGSGEAGVDLLPGSDFLRRLNDRPLATHTRYTIVAGKWCPVDGNQAAALLEKAQRLAESNQVPPWLRQWVSPENQKPAASVLSSAINGLGDGCVTIESARLDGVDDFIIVPANHIDMLINLTPSDEPPPAIPIVIDRLKSS
jgi:pimeloyl-ACP methyl ester carboxylesterase